MGDQYRLDPRTAFENGRSDTLSPAPWSSLWQINERTAGAFDLLHAFVQRRKGLFGETSPDSATRDVALIMAIQKAEHYEIATYGGLITLARTIGQDDVAEILKNTMSEEKEMDELLSGLAENNINEEASTEPANL